MVSVTPFISGGDLHKLWKNTGCFDIELIKIYIGELALAIGNFTAHFTSFSHH